jgi:1-acyl-sn-glycerol-3-phosphate acyltransferase
MKNGVYLKDFGRIDRNKIVRFAFGSPLCVLGKGGEEQQAVNEFIVRELQEWGHNQIVGI